MVLSMNLCIYEYVDNIVYAYIHLIMYVLVYMHTFMVSCIACTCVYIKHKNSL